MDRVYVDPRVHERHPDVNPADAEYAWKNCLKSMSRLDKNPNEYIAIGVDAAGRMLELVALRDYEGDWLIYHAQTPPHARAKRELGLQ